MKNDFATGKVWKWIVAQAVPLTLAQLVLLLYNVIDRIYIGHLDVDGGMALTGIGLTFPIITLIAGFTNLFGTGGSTIFSIERGKQDLDKAEQIMGNAFSCLVISSFVLFLISLLFRKPILFLFGASEQSFVYADLYLKIYIFGTTFVMLATGLNGFINAQGFPKIGMFTTLIGAVLNLILDPIFIFVLKLGVAGAAVATVISQAISAIWVMRFLTGPTAILKLRRRHFRVDRKIFVDMVCIGFPAFIVQGTNALVQIACNTMLNAYGGDLYVGIMTVINSVRELLTLPVRGLTSGSQPVLGYNYGAKKYDRVCDGIRFSTFVGVTYTFLAWFVILLVPRQILSLFTNDVEMVTEGITALHVYFFGFCFMAFQFAGQSTFQSLGYAKKAVFFSLLRKVFIVVPLTFALPAMGLGVMGVYVAEPISNALGGLACFVTMYFTVYKKLREGKVS